MNVSRLSGIAAVALAVAACAEALPGDDPFPPTRPPISVPSIETVDPPGSANVTGEVPEEILTTILADASERTGVAAGSIEVIRGESVTWSDGSLGCPEEGMVYTQALVEGYHVVVDADGEELDYRVGAGGGFRICERPDRPAG